MITEISPVACANEEEVSSSIVYSFFSAHGCMVELGGHPTTSDLSVSTLVMSAQVSRIGSGYAF